MKLKKIVSVALSVAMTAVIFAGCSSSQGSSSSADKILIGGIAPLTGEVAVYGTAVSNAVKLAVEEVNKAGGIGGKQIEFVVEDEEGDAVKAVNAYNKLMSQNVVAIIGDVTSKPTISVAQKAAKDGIPVITPTATAAEVTTYGNNIFRACYLDPYQGQTMATFASTKLSAKTAAVLYDTSDDYSIGVASAFKAKCESLGMTVTNYEGFGKGDKDFKSQLTKIASSNPDVLLVPCYYENDALIATQAKEVGLKSKIIGVDGWDGVLGAVDKSSTSVLEGIYFCNHYYQKDTADVVKNFVKAYEDKYKETPNALAALGYDAAKILFAAIEKAGSTDKDKIVAAMKDISYDGVTGHIAFDANRNPVKSVAMIKIVNGEYTLDSKFANQ